MLPAGDTHKIFYGYRRVYPEDFKEDFKEGFKNDFKEDLKEGFKKDFKDDLEDDFKELICNKFLRNKFFKTGRKMI